MFRLVAVPELASALVLEELSPQTHMSATPPALESKDLSRVVTPFEEVRFQERLPTEVQEPLPVWALG